MPELPSIKFDLTSLKSTVTTALIAPIPTALSSIVGLGLCHPDWLKTFLALPSLGYYTKLVAIVLAAYAIGMVIWLFTALTTVSILIIWSLRSRTAEDSQREKAVRIKLCRAYCTRLGIAEMLPKESEDGEWKTWFATISTALGEWEILPSQMNFYSSVESAALVIGVSMLFCPYHVGWLWIPIVLVFLSGIFGILTVIQDDVDSDTVSTQLLKCLANEVQQESNHQTKNDVC